MAALLCVFARLTASIPNTSFTVLTRYLEVSKDMPYMVQKKDSDIEELLKKNATLEEAVKQLRQKQEAGADKAKVNQVGIIPPIQVYFKFC